MQVSGFDNANVIVVGDVMLDRYWLGPTSRISPEAPVPVVKIEDSDERPGGAANVALNIAALGAKIKLMGMSGEDDAATILKRVLNGVGVDTELTAIPGMDTITKLRVLSRNQQLLRLDFERSFEDVDKTPLIEMVKNNIANTGVLVLSDYAKGVLSDPQPLIQLARAHNIPVVVDPKGDDFERYRGATLLTPNMGEFQAIVGRCHSEKEIVAKAQALMEDLDLTALLVTRSEQGMTLLQKGQPEFHLPAIAREVYDVTGAGDTVVATLAAALASGQSLKSSCTLANIAAGIVVGKLGTSTVSVQELRQALRQDADFGLGVLSQEQLSIAVAEAKARGEKIVMTNGCFDILHAGHVSYLSNAKKLGDRLIVAVNSDDSVKQLKGEGRPINHLERRMAVLAGLASVDWVVDFSEQTPERLISELLPNVLVKGGDYRPEDIAGGKQVIANGGEVKVLNFEDGVSTTGIIAKITAND